MPAVTGDGAYRLLGSLATASQLTSEMLAETCRISERSGRTTYWLAVRSASLAARLRARRSYTLRSGAIAARTTDARTVRGANTNAQRTFRRERCCLVERCWTHGTEVVVRGRWIQGATPRAPSLYSPRGRPGRSCPRSPLGQSRLQAGLEHEVSQLSPESTQTPRARFPPALRPRPRRAPGHHPSGILASTVEPSGM